MTEDSRGPQASPHLDAPARPAQDEERLAALDDVAAEPGTEAFQAISDEIVDLHAGLLARLAQ